MYGVVLGVHLIVCFALVGVILMQSGKGGGLAGGAFGGATQTVFGGRGATDFITRATIGLGVTFFVTSMALALMTANGGPGRSRSLMQDLAKKAQASAPAQPGTLPTGNRGPSLPTGTATPAPTTPAPTTPPATSKPAGGGK